jgi:hypothetical protein
VFSTVLVLLMPGQRQHLHGLSGDLGEPLEARQLPLTMGAPLLKKQDEGDALVEVQIVGPAGEPLEDPRRRADGLADERELLAQPKGLGGHAGVRVEAHQLV